MSVENIKNMCKKFGYRNIILIILVLTFCVVYYYTPTSTLELDTTTKSATTPQQDSKIQSTQDCYNSCAEVCNKMSGVKKSAKDENGTCACVCNSDTPPSTPAQSGIQIGNIKYASCDEKCTMDCKFQQNAALESSQLVNGQCECKCRPFHCTEQPCIDYCNSYSRGFSHINENQRRCYCIGDTSGVDMSPKC